MKKLVFSFTDKAIKKLKKPKEILGGKGANLAEMGRLGLPVPPGFTISTAVCDLFYKNKKQLPKTILTSIKSELKQIEKITKKKFGDLNNPLLVSVRSGARISMPGMMDTILNLGLNDKTVAALKNKTANGRFAKDSYRRFIQMYSNVVLGVDGHYFEETIDNFKLTKGVLLDTDLNEEDWDDLIKNFKDIVKQKAKIDFPQNVEEQLYGAISAVFLSWESQRAKTYRKLNQIPDHWGTAVNVQAMVFGNMGNDCATGVVFTRNPSDGSKNIYGEYLINAQGEDVVAGIRTPHPIKKNKKVEQESLESKFPKAYKEILEISAKLENHFKEVQDIEFTIENEDIYLLQTRKAKRTAQASVKIAIDMQKEGIVSKEEALTMVDANSITNLLHPQFVDSQEKELFNKALNASPGAAVGEIVFDADKAEEEASKGRDVILVRDETSPEDIHGMHSAVGILTTKGGMTSHAAVVARGMGKPCVVGAESLIINNSLKTISNGTTTLNEGDIISIDGGTGEDYIGEIQS